MSWSEVAPAQPESTCSVGVMENNEATQEEEVMEEGHVMGEDDATETPGATSLPLRSFRHGACVKSFLLQDDVSERTSLRMLCKVRLGICGGPCL